MEEMAVVRPAGLGEALVLLAEHGADARPLAGATDAMVRVKEGQWRVPLWLDIRRLPELNALTCEDGIMTVGAAVPYGRMLRSPVLRGAAPLLCQTVRSIGAVQIQAMGTLGGNLGTASPAGDAVAALHALEAHVGLCSRDRGERWVPVEEFIQGPGRTVRQPDELITAVRFAAQSAGERSLWQKLGLRGAQAISIVSLALRVRPGEGAAGSPAGTGHGPASCPTVTFARFAFGAVGPTVLRARQSEAALLAASPLTESIIRSVGQLAWKEVLPISDIRASAEYRRQMAAALLTRGLLQLLDQEVTQG
jgi:carbon-monoxide dehydrogenase medium subunit